MLDPHATRRYDSLRRGKEDVPRPRPAALRHLDRRTERELVAVSVPAVDANVVQRQSLDAHVSQSKQLGPLRDPVMVEIEPHPQLAEDAIAPVNPPVGVSAVASLVEERQGPKTIALGRSTALRSEVAEQLLAIIDHAVAIAIQNEKPILPVGLRPGNHLLRPISVQVKRHAMSCVGQLKLVVSDGQQYWALSHARAGLWIEIAIVIDRARLRPRIDVAIARGDHARFGERKASEILIARKIRRQVVIHDTGAVPAAVQVSEPVVVPELVEK